MRKMLLTLGASALLLAGGAGASQAQQSPSGQAAQQDRRGIMMEHRGKGGPMMRSGMRHRHGAGHGRKGPPMMLMMMAMADTNGDRALSLEEVQAVHARLFDYADTDSDGKLTLAEIRDFFHRGGQDEED